jgi:YecR-like lipoprotein
MRYLLLGLSVLAVSGCTTYKVWTEADADEQTGIVALSYEYRRYENPQVDERAGVEMARERCAAWGYKSAARKGEDLLPLESGARVPLPEVAATAKPRTSRRLGRRRRTAGANYP